MLFIKTLRKQKGLTQEQTAKVVGVSRIEYGRMEMAKGAELSIHGKPYLISLAFQSNY